jgi:hypothetical protein
MKRRGFLASLVAALGLGVWGKKLLWQAKPFKMDTLDGKLTDFSELIERVYAGGNRGRLGIVHSGEPFHNQPLDPQGPSV